jgi:hypothetical protein
MSKKDVSIILLLVSMIGGCFGKRLNPAECVERSVRNERIVCDGRTIAELRILPHERLGESGRLRGLAISYPDSGEERWIYPKRGFKLPNVPGRPTFDQVLRYGSEHQSYHLGDNGKFIGVSSVTISQDGRTISYVGGTLWGPFNGTYDVDTGKRSKKRF